MSLRATTTAENDSAVDIVARRRFRRITICCLKWLFACSLLFAAVVVIGLIPVNNDFVPSAEGIRIFVTSNAVHADVVVPVRTDVIDWRDYFSDECFAGMTVAADHVAIGWGDRGFFLETPTWADLEVGTAANALFRPSETCMHVTMRSAVTADSNTRSVHLSRQQYSDLVNFILAQFSCERGRPRQIAVPGYGQYDAFFEAHGTYHCFNTCNSWVGNALKAAGVRVGRMTPLPKTMFLYLPD